MGCGKQGMIWRRLAAPVVRTAVVGHTPSGAIARRKTGVLPNALSRPLPQQAGEGGTKDLRCVNAVGLTPGVVEECSRVRQSFVQAIPRQAQDVLRQSAGNGAASG